MMIEKLREHLANTPKEQLQKEWDELNEWKDVGPTAQEFIQKTNIGEIPKILEESKCAGERAAGE